MKIRTRVFLVLAMIAALVAATPGVGAQEPGEESREQRTLPEEFWDLEPGLKVAVEERRELNLPHDPEFVASLVGSEADVGTDKYGVVLTQEEVVDYENQRQFEAAVDDQIIPLATADADVVGLWIDHSRGGAIVLQTLESNPALEARIRAAEPADSRGIIFETVNDTREELWSAVDAVWEIKSTVTPELEVLSVAADTPANAVRIEVAPTDLALGDELSAAVQRETGVDVFSVAGERDVESACYTRDHCTAPMKAGNRLHKGSNGGSTCTQGFRVTVGTDDQIVTAGHCGFEGANSWYHQGYGVVGWENSSLYNCSTNACQDIMRIQIDNNQDSAKVIFRSAQITSIGMTPVGYSVCASLGKSATWDCGVLGDDYLTWWGYLAQKVQKGGDVNGMGIVLGDSGSPIVQGASNKQHIGMGIVSTLSGRFARMDFALNSWGISF